MKPILLISGCRKYEEYLHAAIRRMSRPEWTVIGIRGSSSSVSDASGSGSSSSSYDETTQILTLPCADTYEALPAKLHAAYKWIYENRPGIPGIFKTDDDMIFDIPTLVATVTKYTRVPYWGVTASVCKAAPVNTGRILSRFEDTSLRPTHQSAVYCFGAGYWMAAVALPAIAAAGEDYAASALEDVCTGFVMNRQGFMPAKIPVQCREEPRSQQLLDMK